MRTQLLLLGLAMSALASSARAEAPAPTPAASTPVEPVGVAAVGAGAVNVNTASVDELVRLPGVGPAKAAAIVAFREKHGSFKRVDDLDRVKGFGRKLIGKVRPYVALAGPTTYIGKAHSRKEVPRSGERAMR